MRVKHREIIEKEVYLDDSTCVEVTKKVLKGLLGYGDYLRTKEGKTFLVEEIENYHGSSSEKVLREATELDLAIFIVMKALK